MSDMSGPFLVGDKAVYPAHGVGEILAVESREIMGASMEVYVMRIFDRDMTIFIPVKKCEEVGLRPVIEGGEVEKIFDVLKKRTPPLRQPDVESQISPIFGKNKDRFRA